MHEVADNFKRWLISITFNTFCRPVTKWLEVEDKDLEQSEQTHHRFYSCFDSTLWPTVTCHSRDRWHCPQQLPTKPVSTFLTIYGIRDEYLFTLQGLMNLRILMCALSQWPHATLNQQRSPGRMWEKSSVQGWNCLLMVLPSPSCEGCSCLPVLRQMEVAGVGKLSNQTTANIFSLAHYLATTN